MSLLDITRAMEEPLHTSTPWRRRVLPLLDIALWRDRLIIEHGFGVNQQNYRT